MKIKMLLLNIAVAISLVGRSQLVHPQQAGSRYVLELNGQSIEVDPLNGGRITFLKMAGRNFLTDSTVNAFNWGSTFWPSPQSDWNWPPPAEWDNKPYTAVVEGDVLKMEGKADPKTGLMVTKNFSADQHKQCYILEYVITNKSDSARKVAPWEVTRVHTGGIAFFPMGKGEKRGGLIPSTVDKDGICWFTYDQQKIPAHGDTQLYTDGSEGWFAELNGNMIMVKKFPDIGLEEAAPKEGEVELYGNKEVPAKSYVEIEHQGKYVMLRPGESFSWKMLWMLRKVPENIASKAGNNELVEFVRTLVKN